MPANIGPAYVMTGNKAFLSPCLITTIDSFVPLDLARVMKSLPITSLNDDLVRRVIVEIGENDRAKTGIM